MAAVRVPADAITEILGRDLDLVRQEMAKNQS
jgi:hypothetical protein